jgi:hypothetical protein
MEDILSSAASFRIGKLKGKYLIFEIMSYFSHFGNSIGTLVQSSKALRKMVIQNYFSALNILIPEDLEELS